MSLADVLPEQEEIYSRRRKMRRMLILHASRKRICWIQYTLYAVPALTLSHFFVPHPLLSLKSSSSTYSARCGLIRKSVDFAPSESIHAVRLAQDMRVSQK